MKIVISAALFATVISSSLKGAVTLDSLFGPMFDSSGNSVPDGTLWALIAAPAVSPDFGAFDLEGNLFDADVAVPGVADGFFTIGQSISLGMPLSGGTVFAMGETNGVFNGLDGAFVGLIGFDLGVNGAVTSRAFAMLFFPGADPFTGDQNDPQFIGDQVGGFHTSSNDTGLFTIGMTIPADGTISAGATTAAGGGTFANTTFQAVTLIPEPSAALMGAFGALALLRRRRVVEA